MACYSSMHQLRLQARTFTQKSVSYPLSGKRLRFRVRGNPGAQEMAL